jgi:hypothetical protein
VRLDFGFINCLSFAIILVRWKSGNGKAQARKRCGLSALAFWKKGHILYKSLADKVSLPLINSLLLHIAFDSAREMRRLTENSSKMKKILVGEEKQTEDIAPAVRHKNPDASSRSMPESVFENARWLEACA